MPPSPSPSGFASLRARFEQNKHESDSSPPPRGRSPAGGLGNEPGRPLSKIRTNFVAVEPGVPVSHNLAMPAREGDAMDGSVESKEGKNIKRVVSGAGAGAGSGSGAPGKIGHDPQGQFRV